MDWIHELEKGGQIDSADLDGVLRGFEDPTPVPEAEPNDEEGVYSYLTDPPDPGSLSELPLRGWVRECEDSLRSTDENLRRMLGIDDKEALMDIQENTLRILDGCNDPRQDGNWGERNHQGLVYGMIQSGKTASMINLISAGRKAGYRLFVLLAGDKTSLRNQTQERVGEAFDMSTGANSTDWIFTPTWNFDYKHTGMGYNRSFRWMDRIGGQDWTIVIVIKKNDKHIEHLISHVEELGREMSSFGMSFESEFPAMIIDDEADYASTNIEAQSGGDSTIHGCICRLRATIPRNCYVQYTATPQACLSQDPDDPIGYPRDFWWVLEPFKKEVNSQYVDKTYVGAKQVFDLEHDLVIEEMGRHEWPHHEKDARGRPLGVWVPDIDDSQRGVHDTGLTDHEELFLGQIREGHRDAPETVKRALIDYMITCGVRWWREWMKGMVTEKPTTEEIERSYDHHAMMVHMSVIIENQEDIRDLVYREWGGALACFREFSIEDSPDDHPFRQRWRKQLERSKYLRTPSGQSKELPFDEIRYFIERCIEITEKPIMNHRVSPYHSYPSNHWVYLLNSEPDEGMELDYRMSSDMAIRTKKAAIVVGGLVLSRGLTIKGLSTSIFCRSQGDSKGDTNLQMCRWLGHKKSEFDLMAIHMQKESLEIFREITEADRYLRLQIKIALKHGHSPLRVLVELRNSPYFRATSRVKSTFLRNMRGSGFSGKRTMLREPHFDVDKINHNEGVMLSFEERYASVCIKGRHNRGDLYEGLGVDDVIELLRRFKCKSDAADSSFKVYADYLQEWAENKEGNLSAVPEINIAVMNRGTRKRKQKYNSYPGSAEEARRDVSNSFDRFVGGVSDDRTYLGDDFFDKDEEWHRSTEERPSTVRAEGEPILICFYRFNSNYVTKILYDKTRKDADNPKGTKLYNQRVMLESGDSLYVPGGPNVICFASWTPISAPMYGVGVNALIDINKVDQIGTEQIERGE